MTKFSHQSCERKLAGGGDTPGKWLNCAKKALRGSVVVGHHSRKTAPKTLCGVANHAQFRAIGRCPRLRMLTPFRRNPTHYPQLKEKPFLGEGIVE